MKQKESKITGFLVLVVFTVFALCILGVLLTGARGYETLTQRGAETYEYRTVSQYLTTRVRQGDAGLSVEEFAGISTLVLRQEVGGERYLTRIYCYDGNLRELFTAETGNFSPEDGEILLPLAEASFEKEGAMLYAGLTLSDGSTRKLNWHLRTGEVQP